MKIFFVRPPRHLWPFNSEHSAFWQPLAFAALAAYLRRSLPGLTLRIIDCPILKLGWRSLENLLCDDPPDVLAIGEETVSSDEGLRLGRLIKRIKPDCTVIAGGCHYPYAPEHTFAEGGVDYVVSSEGEERLVDLVRVLQSGGDAHSVRGIIYPDGSGFVRTPPRALIENLDDLPLPAYDLLPMQLYGRKSVNHHRLAAVEHGRGCVDSCRFCVIWKQMGRSVQDDGRVRVVPCYRTKSARRSVEEVTWLAKRYGRRTIAWVDGTWNADAAWSEEFCDRLIASKVKVQMLAWMRADAVLRDEEAGILQKQVRAGLVQAMIGLERTVPGEMAVLGKHNNDPTITRKAFRLLARKYPSVYTIGTLIYGIPAETPEKMRRLLKMSYDFRMDYSFLVPLTPNPGSDLWEDDDIQRRLRRRDFRFFNLHTPVMDADQMSVEQLERFYLRVGLPLSPRRLMSVVRNIFAPYARRRTVHRALFRHACSVLWRATSGTLSGRRRRGLPGLYAIRPSWYES